jgi:hypothetical protein
LRYGRDSPASTEGFIAEEYSPIMPLPMRYSIGAVEGKRRGVGDVGGAGGEGKLLGPDWVPLAPCIAWHLNLPFVVGRN